MLLINATQEYRQKIKQFTKFVGFQLWTSEFTVKISQLKKGGEFNCNSRSVGICSKPKFQGKFALWIERECYENSLNFTSQIDSSSILFKSPCRLYFYSKRQLFHSIKKRTRLRVSLCGKPKKILSAVTIDEIGFLFKFVQEVNFKNLRFSFLVFFNFLSCVTFEN